MTGMRISSVSDDTILPNAAPMITATARSRTLPRAMNALNSLNTRFLHPILLTRRHATRLLCARKGWRIVHELSYRLRFGVCCRLVGLRPQQRPDRRGKCQGEMG